MRNWHKSASGWTLHQNPLKYSPSGFGQMVPFLSGWAIYSLLSDEVLPIFRRNSLWDGDQLQENSTKRSQGASGKTAKRHIASARGVRGGSRQTSYTSLINRLLTEARKYNGSHSDISSPHQ